MANTVLESTTVGNDVAAVMYNVTCSTAAATAAKTATASAKFALFSGVRVRVTFTNANTAESPTLNINTTSDVPIMLDGSTAAGNGTWSAGSVVDLMYNGTNWVIAGAGTGVSSFNGRSGVVLPQSGDYTPDMVGAVPVYGGGVNLLDNWYFIGGGSQQGGGRFPINQRGQTSYTGSGYGIDRWQFRLNSAGASAMQLSSNGIAFTKDSPYHGMVQCVATASEFSRYAGKTVTISALLVPNSAFSGRMQINLGDATNAGAIGTSLFRGQTPIITSNIGLISGTVQLPDALQNSYFTAAIASVDGFDTEFSVMAAKLELGDHQTLAHQDASGNWILNDPPPNFQQELAKCQRYLLVLKPTTGNALVAHGFGQDSTHYRFSVPTPVSMLPPTSVTMTGQVQILANGSYKDVYDLSVLWGSNGNSVNIAASLQEASSAFELYGYAMLAVIGSSSSIIISAEP